MVFDVGLNYNNKYIGSYIFAVKYLKYRIFEGV